jgi:hypothetical protein
MDRKPGKCAASPPARPVDAHLVRVVLLLRLSGADLSADVAARAVPHFRRQYRVGDDRRHRLHAGTGSGQLGGRLFVEAARHRVTAAPCRHRTDDRGIRSGVAAHFRARRRIHHRPAVTGFGGGQSGAGDCADLVDGRDAAAPGGASGSPLRPGGKRARATLLRQYAWRRRGVPCLRRVSLSVRRHAGRGLCRRRDECGGGRGRHDRALV